MLATVLACHGARAMVLAMVLAMEWALMLFAMSSMVTTIDSVVLSPPHAAENA